MTKLARVIYAYRPKNDDELELNVDDKIEFIGVEEEGWWKGKLKGRIGVFPSNFVVIETGSPSTTQSSTTNKLNSIFGSKVSSKNSISSNSLNSINNNGGSNKLTNNNNSSSNSNLIMNNTQPEIDSTSDHPFASADESFHSATSAIERRPRPIRGNGFGDIFAAGAKLKPLPADVPQPTALASERLSTIASNLTSTLQKPIPKKPPPPEPAADCNPNGSSSDQAPALPPKPSNQASPFMQPISRPPLSTASNLQAGASQVREQARVLFAYKASNPDELDIEAGDIITVLDKKIDDVGWWRGVLNGKIGVFPDNFVELIKVPDDWQSGGTRVNSANQQSALGFTHQHQLPNNENKIKSVFASTPKGFSKELENNLEKHGNPASFLSLKRNKLQQQQQVMSDTTCDPAAIGTAIRNDANNKPQATDAIGPLETNSTKLNHITANRAKGPSRRPPSNVLNKRNGQSNLESSPGRRETNGRGDDFALGSLPVNSSPQTQINQESLSSLPTGQQIGLSVIGGGLFSSSNHKSELIKSPVLTKSSQSIDVVVDNQQVVGPKSNQRPQQPPPTTQALLDKITTSPPTRPPWMVELRKSNLEKKRDASVSSIDEITTRSSKPVEPPATPSNVVDQAPAITEVTPSLSPQERKNSIQSLRETYNPTVTTVKSISSRYSSNEILTSNNNQAPGIDSPRATLLGGVPVSTQQPQNASASNEILSSPMTERSNNLFNKANPINRSEALPIANINENGNNTVLVPSNMNKSPNVLPIKSDSDHKNDVNTAQKSNSELSSSFEKSPKVFNNKISDPVGQKQIDGEDCKFIMTKTQYDNLLMQISKNLTSEISELKNDVKQLQEEFKSVGELKVSLEAMKIELKTCQSATENQKRYIRELVNNLADERKKIASMQGEIERNLK